ncbi:phosphatidylinositol 3,4,5-trisphosphate 3-phosphatase TPTE2 isoform X2 [Anolis carolinensis]|uniref:phosphatidylinositol 3,4,5-trisphosphate 3-phosphatase TPTE2 isoform X2 n=1 Tax=Anolis carolinensis TaxID=28377 RepID=UPI002F2B2F3E
MKTVKNEQSLEFQDSLGTHPTKEPTVTIDDGVDEDDDEQNSLTYKIKKIISPFVMSFGFRLFGIVLIFVDLALVVLSLLVGDKYLSLEHMIGNISLAIALFFLLDVSLRVFVEGFRKYFESNINILDAIIILGTLLVNIVYCFSDLSGLSQIPRTVILFRILRIIILARVVRLASEKERLEKVTRRMDVAKFLDIKHEGHYKVYNLCSEQGYDPKYFHYRVERMFIDDHNVPTLEDMLKFTASVRKWMQQDENNVIAIHCKGGKGRTGTMICIWLIDSNQFDSAKDSLNYFGERRTDTSTSSKFQGVETPSQSRYVGYYATLKFVYNLNLPPVRPLKIKSIKLYAIHDVGKGNGTDLRVMVIKEKRVVFRCFGATQENCKLFFDGENDWVVIGLENCPVVKNDVKIRFESSSDIPKGYDDCVFFFWFNTSFIEDNRLYLPRNELDNLHKPKMWKTFSEKFAVEVNFTEP